MELSRGFGGEFVHTSYVYSYLYMVSCSKEEKRCGAFGRNIFIKYLIIDTVLLTRCYEIQKLTSYHEYLQFNGVLVCM